MEDVRCFQLDASHGVLLRHKTTKQVPPFMKKGDKWEGAPVAHLSPPSYPHAERCQYKDMDVWMDDSKSRVTGLRSGALFLVVSVILSGGCAAAPGGGDKQTVQESPKAEAVLEHFVPRGWVVFESAKTDLDGDGDEDVIALVDNKSNAETKPPR